MKIRFKLTKSDSQSATRVMSELIPKHSWVNIVNLFGSTIGAFLITISSIIIIQGLSELFKLAPETVICLTTLLIGLFIFISTKLYVKRILTSKVGLWGSIITYELSDNKIVCWTNDNIKTEIMPVAILKVIQKNGFLLIYVAENYSYFIPLYAFSDDAERSAFLENLKQISDRVC